MPDCGSLAAASRLKVPDWCEFTHRVLPKKNWNALPAWATGAESEMLGALVSTVNDCVALKAEELLLESTFCARQKYWVPDWRLALPGTAGLPDAPLASVV